MPDGFPNKPKILRGAFVEFGLSLPPLIVVFQFNPLQLTRNRALTFAVPAMPTPPPAGRRRGRRPRSQPACAQFHDRVLRTCWTCRSNQLVTVQEQTIGFDIRLDATDKLDDGDSITEQFGIAPQLSTLELMVHPKEESLLGTAVERAAGQAEGLQLHPRRRTRRWSCSSSAASACFR